MTGEPENLGAAGVPGPGDAKAPGLPLPLQTGYKSFPPRLPPPTASFGGSGSHTQGAQLGSGRHGLWSRPCTQQLGFNLMKEEHRQGERSPLPICGQAGRL